MSKLQILDITWMTATIDRNDMVYAWRHGVGILKTFINCLSTNSTNRARGQDDSFVSFKRKTMCPVMIWTIALVRVIAHGSKLLYVQ